MKNHAVALLRTFSSGYRTVISHDIFDSPRIVSAYLGIQPTSVHVVAFRHNLFLTTGPIFSFRYEVERKCFHIYIFCANFDRRALSSSLPNNIYTHAYIYINSKDKPRGVEGASWIVFANKIVWQQKARTTRIWLFKACTKLCLWKQPWQRLCTQCEGSSVVRPRPTCD